MPVKLYSTYGDEIPTKYTDYFDNKSYFNQICNCCGATFSPTLNSKEPRSRDVVYGIKVVGEQKYKDGEYKFGDNMVLDVKNLKTKSGDISIMGIRKC